MLFSRLYLYHCGFPKEDKNGEDGDKVHRTFAIKRTKTPTYLNTKSGSFKNASHLMMMVPLQLSDPSYCRSSTSRLVERRKEGRLLLGEETLDARITNLSLSIFFYIIFILLYGI